MYVIHNEITAHITVIIYKMSLSCKRIEYLVFFVVYVLERIHYFLLVVFFQHFFSGIPQII